MENTQKKSAAAEKEEKILQFWRDNKTFEKSLTKDAPKGNYVFYDGPPFATGLPHYGHILGSTAKDVIGRYQTMQGFRVPRKWGWDCHGLPIENIVEKDLGLSGHVEIENLGIDKFVEHARSKVLTYVNEWKRTVERIGRWVDFDGSYKTMDNSFIESVWWALGQMNDKGLLYEGVRVLAYCPRCETPIAKSEIAMDNSYKDIADISVYVNMPLVEDTSVNLIAWTTTPWSLPGDIVLAVKGDAIYVKAKIEDKFYVVAKDRAEAVFKDKAYEIVDEFAGSTLVGKKYIPPFDYYTKGEALLANPKSWTVVAADFVTTTDGTGIAHEAPAFGEDDANLAHKENIPFIVHVTPEGKFAPEVTDFAGMPIKPKSSEKDGHMKADIEILKYLQAKGTLFKKEKIMHSYPHCYRCETPLFYYALPSWFINIQTPKARMLETAKSMEWIPAHLKDGRFKHTMEGAPDWNISRNRYWASPLPFWKSESGKFLFANSVEDLKKKTKNSGNTYFVMRHGEADNNLDQVHVPDSHIHAKLTQKGKDTVLENAKKFGKKVDVIIASPYERAYETAKITAEAIGFPVEKIITDERFRECDVPHEFDNKSRDILRQYYDLDYASDSAHEFSEGENFVQLTARLGEFLYDVDTQYKGQTILLVGHRASGRALRFVTEGHRFEDLPTLKMHDHDFDNAEIRELPFVPLPHNARYEFDLHRPYIDEIVLVDEAGEEYKRIPEVIDCWFESGSMPFAQDHYPFERPEWMKENFPAGFVAEYIAQTRTWFYYTHAVSTVLFDAAPFKNVVTTGTLLAEDGQKMSKSKNNFPDPWLLFDKYGVDPLRLYLMSSPLMKGEDSNFSEKLVQEIASKVIGRLMNVVTFYELYRDESLEKGVPKSSNVLDQWIMARLGQVVEEVTKGMDAYDMTEATRPLDLFVDDLSTWYLRRSRERIKDGEGDAKATLYYALMTVAKIMAPLAPFTAEDIWQRLKHADMEESVHLSTWPEGMKAGDAEVLETMRAARELVTLGLQARQKKGIPVRQPLPGAGITGTNLTQEYIEILSDELNVKQVNFSKDGAFEIVLDFTITPELKKEGDYRELVRGVQELRKKAGLTPSDTISLSLSDNAKNFLAPFEEDMKKTVLAKELSYGDTSGEEVAVGEGQVTASIVKLG